MPFYFSNKGFPGLAVALPLTGRPLTALTLFSLALSALSCKEQHAPHFVSMDTFLISEISMPYKMDKGEEGRPCGDLRR